MRINTTIRPGLIKFEKQDYFDLYMNHLGQHWMPQFNEQISTIQYGFSEWFGGLVKEVVARMYCYTNPKNYMEIPNKLDITEKHLSFLIDSKLTRSHFKIILKLIRGLEQHFIRTVMAQFEYTNRKTDCWGVLRDTDSTLIFNYLGDFRILEWEAGRSKKDFVAEVDDSLNLDFSDGEWVLDDDGNVCHVSR